MPIRRAPSRNWPGYQRNQPSPRTVSVKTRFARTTGCEFSAGIIVTITVVPFGAHHSHRSPWGHVRLKDETGGKGTCTAGTAGIGCSPSRLHRCDRRASDISQSIRKFFAKILRSHWSMSGRPSARSSTTPTSGSWISGISQRIHHRTLRRARFPAVACAGIRQIKASSEGASPFACLLFDRP